jgi:YVTN family beta-propeller protein
LAEGASMHGIRLSPDDRRLYVTAAGSAMMCYDIGKDGRLGTSMQITLRNANERAREGKVIAKRRASFPNGLAITADGRTAYVCLSIGNSLAIVDLASGKMTGEIEVGVAPYDVLLSADGRTAYVSNWGGRRTKDGDHIALSAGTPTLVDAHGVAASGTIGVVDLKTKKMTAEIDVGLHPSAMVLSHDGKTLFVANANSDTVSEIDLTSRKVVRSIGVRPDASLPFGSAPNALALSADGKTLFAANGGNNAVAVLDLDSGKPRGFIPAGWYPGALAIDGDKLFVVNVKGVGSRDASRVKSGWSSHYSQGTINRVTIPDAPTLEKYTKQALADAHVPESLRAAEKAASNVPPVPIPNHVGEPSKIEHVIYVIKENRTYDQFLGDMKQGNGSPDLCVFGRKVTPNHHAIAEQFALLDNYYCNGVVSADGHQWATQGDVADGIEKTFGGFTRSYPFQGDDPLAFVSSGFLWQAALAHGLSFRNYGEMSGGRTEPPGASFTQIYKDLHAGGKMKFSTVVSIVELRKYTCMDYPGWNLAIPDAVRLNIFLKEFRQFQAKGELPNLITLYLPSDHTRGTTPNTPTPQAMIADNDLAVGKVVEAASHSRFWPSTCIFVIEDDPQAGFDHVDGHRSICLVASPYTRRHAVISAFYNQTSILHTMELILGLPAMNQLDAMAPVMRECFTDEADLTPYVAVPNEIPLDQMNGKLQTLNSDARHWAEASLAQKFDEPDQIDDETFNRVLWFAAKGTAAYPADLAGPHGRGLGRLGLKLNSSAPKDDD